MQTPEFWFRPPGWQSALLAPVAAVVGAVAGRRFARPPVYRAPVPVLCVGNPTVGGAGKTPTVQLLIRIVRELGRRPMVLSRGHGGRLTGPVMVDPTRHTAADVGDEPLLLSADAPVVISRDRPAGARLAVAQGAELILMDDGFQNPGLYKDLSLLVLDARRGIGNGRVLPAGPLRLALAPQLARAGALMVIGEGTGADPVVLAAAARGLPVHHGWLEPAADFTGVRALAFSGIGDPAKFHRSLEEAGAEIVGLRSFADHHPFSEAEAAALLAEAEALGAVPVTTEKDRARLVGAEGEARRALLARLRTLPVRLRPAEPETLRLRLAALFGRA